MLLLIYCLMYSPFFWSYVFVFIFYTLLCAHSSLAIILKRKSELVALLLLS